MISQESRVIAAAEPIAQQIKEHWLLIHKTQAGFPAPTPQLTTIHPYKSISKGSDAFSSGLKHIKINVRNLAQHN